MLDLTVGHVLFNRYPNMKEGELTRLRSALVNERNLADMARQINLGEFLHLGRGEDSSLGREKDSILSSAYEAVVGAIFVDSGYDRVEEFVEKRREGIKVPGVAEGFTLRLDYLLGETPVPES